MILKVTDDFGYTYIMTRLLKSFAFRNACAELAQSLELASLGERRGAVGTSRDSAEARKRDEGSLPLFYLSLTASQKLNNEKIKGNSVYKRVFQSRKHYSAVLPYWSF